jgi:predicted double-glycine peptidase
MLTIRTALLKLAADEPSTRAVILPMTRQAEKWQSMPKGWTNESRKKFWDSLTGGAPKHKVTKCIKQMEGKGGIDDPGAFCASLADRVLGKEWRSKKKAATPPKPPRYLKRRAPAGHYQVWMSRENDPSPYISDYPSIQVAIRRSRETAALNGVINVVIYDDLGNQFKTMKKAVQEQTTNAVDGAAARFKDHMAFDQFNVPELLGQLKKVLLNKGLDDTWEELRKCKVPQKVNDAWMGLSKKERKRAAKTAKANVEPVRQRTQYSCMASSMTMCLRALGHKLTEDEVNSVMGARPMKGAAWEQALATAQHYGCRATLTMPATVEQLKAWTDQGVPIMIAWNPEGREWSHASVVFDVDDDLNVYVADPNIPNPKETVRIVSENDFYGKWYEKFPNYLVRRPACAIDREITTVGKQVMPTADGDPSAFIEFQGRIASKQGKMGSDHTAGRVMKPGDDVLFWQGVNRRDGTKVMPKTRGIIKSVAMKFTTLGPKEMVPVYSVELSDGQVVENIPWHVLDSKSFNLKPRDLLEQAFKLLVKALKPFKLKRTNSRKRNGRRLEVPYGKVVSQKAVRAAISGIPGVKKNGLNYLIPIRVGEKEYTDYEVLMQNYMGQPDGFNGVEMYPTYSKAGSGRSVRDNSGRTWAPRRGLEGPFLFKGNRVLYYDPREKGGSYYDPTTDMYLDHGEASRAIMAASYGVSVKKLRSGEVVVNAGPSYQTSAKRLIEKAGFDFRLIEDRAGSWIFPKGMATVDELMKALAGVDPVKKEAAASPLDLALRAVLKVLRKFKLKRETGSQRWVRNLRPPLTRMGRPKVPLKEVLQALSTIPGIKEERKGIYRLSTYDGDVEHQFKIIAAGRYNDAESLDDVVIKEDIHFSPTKKARAKRKNKPESMKTKMKTKKEVSKTRNPIQQGISERGGMSGGGSHKNRDRAIEKGHSRKVKHKKKYAAAITRLSRAYVRMATEAGSFKLSSREEVLVTVGWGPGFTLWDNLAGGRRLGQYSTGSKLAEALRDILGATRPLPNSLHDQIRQLTIYQDTEVWVKWDGRKWSLRPGHITKLATEAAYSGNPDGKPIYDVEINHGEYQALAGGTDIMTRLQDEYRVEQGHEVRDPQPRLARSSSDTAAKVEVTR